MRLRDSLPPLVTLLPFEAAGRLASFTAAAQELCVTQAAISRQIKQLEQTLGATLFERRHRAVALTEEGQRLYDAVSAGLATIASGVQDVRQTRTGEVTIYCELSLAAYWLVPRLPRFERLHTAPRIRVIASNQPHARVSEPYDLAMQTSLRPSDTLTPVVSVREEIFPVCSPELLEQYGSAVTAEQLGRATLLSFRDDSYPWIDWPEWMQRFGYRFSDSRRLRTYNNYPVLLQATIAGQGFALGWKSSIEPMLQDGRLVRALDLAFTIHDGIHVYRPARGELDRNTRTVLRWLAGELGGECDASS